MTGVERAPRRRRRLWAAVAAGALLAVAPVVAVLVTQARRPAQVGYSAFVAQLQAGNVASVTAHDHTLTVTLAEPVAVPVLGGGERELATFATTLPSFAQPELAGLLAAHGVDVSALPADAQRHPLVTYLLQLVPALLLLGGGFLLVRRLGGNLGFAIGKSEPKRFDGTALAVTFADVAGIDEAKAELEEVVDFLKNPHKYTRLGGTAPKGVLLVGEPGTGKTLLAKAVAGEAGVPFFSMNASEFVEMIVGVGASRARDLFKKAREAAPAIVFIDELDAIGRARGAGSYSGANAEQEQALNQILTEMDGFSAREGVIVIGATNRPDVLDPALLRPGRFDRRVTVQAPDKAGRLAVLQVHTRGVPLADDVDLAGLAAKTPGLVGAELRNLVNEAALAAARRDAEAVARCDFEDALEKLVLGPKRPLVLSERDRERIAYHEAGHAIVGLVEPEADPVTRVTITPRGHSLGVTYQAPDDDRYNYTEAYVRARIVGALGGRAAEELVYGDRTTGAENDLEQVTKLARMMVTRWGMGSGVGPLSLASRDDPYLGGGAPAPSAKPLSEEMARRVDAEVARIVDECYRRAKELLETHRDRLEALTRALLEHESLDEPEILAVVGLEGKREDPVAA
ncbi:MAG TPA: ATP-dependent zinc metalloprotease FtsH [Trueperaceae bacterium]|nr:ATP-dependent zinc metalloprotease FtsH [Trueperaceae bacterium]